MKSIRLVIVFSYKRIGARGEGLKEILNFYSKIICDSGYIEYFNFFFTHVDKGVNIRNLEAKFRDILEYLNPREKMNERMVNFLKAIISRAEDNKLYIIDPLNKKEILKILSEITKTYEISGPCDIF